MIHGHGDDAYNYHAIRANFSSNICQHADHALLKAYLTAHFHVVDNYPEPEPWTLERQIAHSHGIDPECVIVTNGATDAIYLVAQAYAHLPYAIDQPAFSEYEDACRLFELSEGTGGLCWVCNPRNPDGYAYSSEEIGRLADSHRLLVVDQAYERYTCQSLLSPREAVDRRNVIQLHSMTKTYAIPGLRLGYLVAHADITAHLRRHLRPWSVNALAIEAGRFLLQHDELLVRPDLCEAQRLHARLSAIDGLVIQPTATNFMLCCCTRRSSGWLTAATLKERLALRYGLLIRDASNFRGLTAGHFRIASQTPAENNLLVEAITELMKEQ